MASVIPAYGRDYRNKAALLADWEADKDFLYCDGWHETYINKSDASKHLGPESILQFRYDRGRKAFAARVRELCH